MAISAYLENTFSNTIPHYANLPDLNKVLFKAYNTTVIYARSRPKIQIDNPAIRR